MTLDKNHHWRLIIEDELKYIKAILSIPEVMETIKDCQIQFKFSESEQKIERKYNFDSAFDEILREKLDDSDKEIRDYFYNQFPSNKLE